MSRYTEEDSRFMENLRQYFLESFYNEEKILSEKMTLEVFFSYLQLFQSSKSDQVLFLQHWESFSSYFSEKEKLERKVFWQVFAAFYNFFLDSHGSRTANAHWSQRKTIENTMNHIALCGSGRS